MNPEEITHKEYRGVSGAYVITHKPTGKSYVGSTNDLYMRTKRHVNDLNKGACSNAPLQSVFNDSADIDLKVYKTSTREEAYQLEQKILDENNNLFNIATDAKLPTKGKTLSPEHLEKLRESNIGRSMPDDLKQKLIDYHTGRKKSDEEKFKIGEARRGKSRPIEELNKYIETRRNNGIPVRINNVDYRSIGDASDELGVKYMTIYHRCSSDTFPDWQFIGNKRGTQTFTTEPENAINNELVTMALSRSQAT